MMEPKLSIIIPVLQEGDRIRSCLDHLTNIAEDISYEVIVSDGDPQGSTLSALPHQYAVGVRSPLGRGAQLNAGARVATGKILLFLHVDACLSPRALHQILETCEQQEWAGGAFDLVIASPRLSLKVIGKVASWRSRLTRIPYGDQAIFLRRDIFEQVQGYPDIAIMEDVALMQRLKRQGYAIKILASAVAVSPRRWEHEGILRCTLRNWSLITLYTLGIHPNLLARWYRPASPTG